MAAKYFEVGKMYISTTNGLIIKVLNEYQVKVTWAGESPYKEGDKLDIYGWVFEKFDEYVVPASSQPWKMRAELAKGEYEIPDVPPGMSTPVPALPEGVNCDTITFTFWQDANCVDGGETEELTIEAKSSLGITNDDGAFYVIKTNQWAVNGAELQQIIDRCKESVDTMVRKDK